jgi:copper chaperone CopZ
MFNAKQEAKPESIEVQLRLPNMKTDADAEVVAQSLKSIQGATNVNTDVAKQMVSFVVPNKTRLRQTIQNFVNGGKDVFKDWTVAEKTEDKTTQNSVDDADGKKPSVAKPGAANSGG